MTATGAAKALIVRNLVKSYGKLQAVADVSLEVDKGECFALLGPNGAGKTTTCEMLEGLIAPDAGEVKIFGQTYRQSRMDILRQIGVQLQETNLYKKYTVRETLELFASFYDEGADIETLLRILKLEDKAGSRLEHLSGGQKQRAYLGCSLVNNPRLLFLDEPTAGLDPQARRYVWDLLKELKKEKRSIFLTTHYMDEARELADRVAVMDKGHVIAVGTVDELIRQNCPEELLTFIPEGPGPEGLLRYLPWLEQATREEDKWEVRTEGAAARVPELFRAADQAGINIATFAIRQPTLEDVFLKLTGRRIRDAQ